MIPGFTSTGSKRPDTWFGVGRGPRRMVRAEGCRVWDDADREFLDCTMALGAVSLGYAHPAVVSAVQRAVADGGVGPLAPTLESRVAERLAELFPVCEDVLFFKTGAEAVAAAVRIARVHTGRDRIVLSGYQGWLDPFSDAVGVPESTQRLQERVAFNDVAGLEGALAAAPAAAVVVEPIVDGPPTAEWIAALRRVAARGALLVVDEIKTGLRMGAGGAATRFDMPADLLVLGKALGNGLPIAAVGGPRDAMQAATRTWISSTLATEFVSLAAADAVLDVYADTTAARQIADHGKKLWRGLEAIASRFPSMVTPAGVPEMCYLRFPAVDLGRAFAAACADRGLLFKRDAYNFVSVAHTASVLDRVLQVVAEALAQCEGGS